MEVFVFISKFWKTAYFNANNIVDYFFLRIFTVTRKGKKWSRQLLLENNSGRKRSETVTIIEQPMINFCTKFVTSYCNKRELCVGQRST